MTDYIALEDEREAFESWIAIDHEVRPAKELLWACWMARAALSVAPIEPAQDREDACRAELQNIVNAKRWDHDIFPDDTDFADWVLSRARFTLAARQAPKEPT